MSNRVGDWLRASEGMVLCPRRSAPAAIEECSHCGFGTRIDPGAIGVADVVRCMARAQEAGPAQEGEGQPAERKARSQTVILLVDDDFASARSLARLLRDDGYVVEIALDGGTAINRLARDPLPDVLVTDVRLPHVDGTVVAEYGRSRSANLPILFVTARERVSAPGGRALQPPPGLMTKPLDYDRIAAWIEAARAA